jgi:hypothetical protein
MYCAILAVVACIHCTHTVDGTGPAPPNAGSSGLDPLATCTDVNGTWDLKGGALDACATESCAISQTVCSLRLVCTGGTYTGTINGGDISWTGKGGRSCNATLGPADLKADGECVGIDGACELVVTKR